MSNMGGWVVLHDELVCVCAHTRQMLLLCVVVSDYELINEVAIGVIR